MQSGMGESHGNSIFNFLKHHHTAVHNSCITYSHQQWKGCQFLYISATLYYLLDFCVVLLFNNSHFGGYKTASPCGTCFLCFCCYISIFYYCYIPLCCKNKIRRQWIEQTGAMMNQILCEILLQRFSYRKPS